MKKIEVVKVYRVRGDRKTYRTYKAVVKRLAWISIFKKYGDSFDDYGVFTGIKTKCRYKCECDFRSQTLFEEWKDCPVHDRTTGYIRRLHNRLSSYIMSCYPSNHLGKLND